MKMNEKQLRNLIRESVEEAINEISPQLVRNVTQKYQSIRPQQARRVKSDYIYTNLDNINDKYSFDYNAITFQASKAAGGSVIVRMPINGADSTKTVVGYVLRSPNGAFFLNSFQGIPEAVVDVVNRTIQNLPAGPRKKLNMLYDALNQFVADWDSEYGI